MATRPSWGRFERSPFRLLDAEPINRAHWASEARPAVSLKEKNGTFYGKEGPSVQIGVTLSVFSRARARPWAGSCSARHEGPMAGIIISELTVRLSGDDKSARDAIKRTKAGLASLTTDAKVTVAALGEIDAMLDRTSGAAAKATASFDLFALGTEAAAKGSSALNRSLAANSVSTYAVRVEAGGKALGVLGTEADATKAKLGALNAEYGRLRSMKAPTIGGGSAGGGNGAAGTGPNLGKLASSTSQIGGALTRDVTLPLLAIDAASIKMNTDFEAAMGKVRALGGVSKEQADAWSASVLKMGPAIGQSPKALADALLYVSSEGYRSAEAMSILDRAGRMSSVGMGSVATNARAVVFAMHDFAYQHLTAAQASDALTAATRTGNFQIDQLSGSLSRVLPIAANLGITFPQTVAAIAGITKAGAPAGQAVTDLARILMTFEHPTTQTSKALGKLGLDVGEVTEHMRKDFLGALVEIEGAAKGNEAQFTKVFGSVKAFGGVLALTGGNLKEARAGFDSVVHSAGTLGRAFDAGKDQASRSMAQFKAQMEADGIAIASALVPSLKAAEGDVMAVGRAFTDLSPDAQRAIVDLGLVAAVTGPLVAGVGKVAGGITALRTATAALSLTQGTAAAATVTETSVLGYLSVAEGTAAVAAGALDVALLPLVVTIGAVGLAGYGLYKALEYLNTTSKRSTDSAIEDARARAISAVSLARHSAAVATNRGHIANLYREYEVLRDKTGRTADEEHRFNVVMGQIGEANPGLITAFNDQGRTVGLLGGQYANLAAEADRAASASRRAANEARIAQVQAAQTPIMLRAMSTATDTQTNLDAAKERLAGIRAGTAKIKIYDDPNAARIAKTLGNPEPRYHFAVNGRDQQTELAKQSQIVANLQAQRNAQIAQSKLLHEEEVKAFKASQQPLPPTEKSKKDNGSNHHNGNGGGGGGGGNGRSKESDATREANQAHQALLDTLNREGTAYLLLGNSSDAAATKLEIQTGQYANQRAQLDQLNGLVKTMANAGVLDKAAQSLGLKDFASTKGDTRLKVEVLALANMTEARKRDMAVAADARKAEAENTKDAIKQIQDARHAANEARLEFLKTANPSPKDQAAFASFGVPFRDLKDPKAIAAVTQTAGYDQATESLKAYAEAWKKIGEAATEGTKKEREAIAAGIAARASLMADLQSRNAALRAKTPEDSTAAHVGSYFNDHRDAFSAPGQSWQGAVGNIAGVTAIIAQNDALAKGAAYASAYDQAMRSLRREYIGLTDASIAARIATVEFTESGSRAMDHWQAANAVALQKEIDHLKLAREQSREAGDAAGRGFTDGMNAALEHGVGSGLKAFVLSLDKQIQEAVVAAGAKGIGSWVTRSIDARDPRQHQDPTKSNGTMWDAMGGVLGKAMGRGKDAALIDNTKAIVALTVKLATKDLGAGTGGLVGGIFGGGTGSRWPSLLSTGAGRDTVGDALAQGVGAMHFATGGHVQKGQKGIWQENRDGSGGEGFLADKDGSILPRAVMEAAERGGAQGNILPRDLMDRANRSPSGGSGAGGQGGSSDTPTEVHHHTHNVSVSPVIHISGPIDRRSESQIHAAVGNAVRDAMNRHS